MFVDDYFTSLLLNILICCCQGTNLDLVPESDYSVTVGGQPCTELNVNEAGTAITCLPPQSVSVFGLLELEVNVSMYVNS